MDAANDLPRRGRIRFEESTLEELLGEWRKLGRDCLQEVRGRIQDRPVETLAVAFLAGAVFGALFGRRP
jgi:hypothetical protein